jgi:tripartite-type tricarboxylate transporter receptor subunit TctC
MTGFAAYVWMGLLAPKGTPPAIIDRLSRELKLVMALPEVKTHFAEAGIEIVASSPSEMDAYFRSERDHWAKVVKDTGAKID